MNIEVAKFELLNKLLSTTDEQLLEQLLAVFKKSEKDESLSLIQYNNELAAAEERIKSGKFTSQEDLEIESQGW